MKRIIVINILFLTLLLSACATSGSQIQTEEIAEPEPDPIVTYSIDQIVKKYQNNKFSINGLYLKAEGRVDRIDKWSQGGYYVRITTKYKDNDTFHIYCDVFGEDAEDVMKKLLDFNIDDTVEVIGTVRLAGTGLFDDTVDTIYIDYESHIKR